MFDTLEKTMASSTERREAGTGSVQLASVSKHYGGSLAVDDVSLEIERGEFITLLGASGSGKSTLLNLIAGFLEPSSGSIRLDGTDLVGVRPHRRNMGVMFQNYALFPHMTVEANIAYPLQQRKISKAEIRRRVGEVLDLVQLSAYAKRLPRQLSGGQQQRVALARSIVFEPPVLLLDEPMGALDKALRESLQFEMKRIHEQLRITFIHVTHDQSEALAMSDRIAVLRSGRLEQVGTPRELYYQPATRYVAEFMGESNLFEGEADGGAPLMAIASAGLTIHAANAKSFAAGTSVTASIRPEHVQVARIDGSATPQRDAYRGRIAESTFLGSQRRVEVVLESGRQLTAVHAAENAAATVLSVGDEIQVTWRPDDVIVVAS